MTKVSKFTLRSYFEAGDTPTEQNFIDLIESLALQTELDAVATNSGVSLTRANGGETSGATRIDVDDSSIFQVGDTVGFTTDSSYQERAITAIDTVGTDIDVAAISGDLADNAPVLLIIPTLAGLASAINTDQTLSAPVAIGYGIGTEYYPEAYHASGTVNETSINAAISAAATDGGGVVVLPGGTITTSGEIIIKNGVSLVGQGMGATTISWDGTDGDAAIVSDPANATPNKGRISGFTITMSADAAVSGMDFRGGINQYTFQDIVIQLEDSNIAGIAIRGQEILTETTANGAGATAAGNTLEVASTTGLAVGNYLDVELDNGDFQPAKISNIASLTLTCTELDDTALTWNANAAAGNLVYEMATGNGHNAQFNCIFLNVRVENINGAGFEYKYGFWFHGWEDEQADAVITNGRVNGHRLLDCTVNRAQTAVWCGGNGNTFNLTINTATNTAFLFSGESNNGNTILGSYIDSGVAGNHIELYNISTTDNIVSAIGGIGLTLAKIYDDVGPGTNSEAYLTSTDTMRWESLQPGVTRLSEFEAYEYIKLAIPAADIRQTSLTALDSTTKAYSMLRGIEANGFIVAARGNEAATAGHLIVSGASHSGGINAIADQGSVSAAIEATSGAEFRVVKTADGINYTKLLVLDDDATFTQVLNLANNIGLQAKDSGGTKREVLKVDGSDVLLIGSTNLGDVQIQGGSAATLTLTNITNVINGTASAGLIIASGTSGTGGGNMGLYGTSHATLANQVRFRTGSTVAFYLENGGTGVFNYATSIGTTNHNAMLDIDQASSSGAKPVLILDQADDSEGFIDYLGNSAASATGPISTWTAGNSIQGFLRVEINGTGYWMPFYDAPTS